MTRISKCAVAAAAFAIASTVAEAGTIAWYHFDEVAPGTRLVSSDTILNAVDSTKLQGQPHSASYTTLGSDANFMPTATNDVSDTVYVVDPVGGTTNRNERSLYFTYADNESSGETARYGGGVHVPSDSSLSLENVTVEFFVRPMRLTSKTNNGWQFVAKESTGNAKFTYSICVAPSGKPYVNCYDSDGNLMSSTGVKKFNSPRSLMDGHWHHVAFTSSGTTAKLYVDYNLEDTAELPSELYYVDDGRLYIGASRMGYYMPGGFIDEVRISDGVLDPTSFLRLLDKDPKLTCFHLDFETSFRAELPHVVGTPATGTVARFSSLYPLLTNDVPSATLANRLGETLRATNACSVYLDGGYVTYPHLDVLEAPEVTVECFVKYVAASNWANIVRFNKANANWYTKPIWCLGFNGNKLFMRIDTTQVENNTKTFGDTVLDGRWHHVAVTIAEGASGITVKVYDNYKQIGTTWNIDGFLDYSLGSCLGLGLSSVGANAPFNGFVDEVRISRGVLSVDEFLHKGRSGMMLIFR